MPRGQGISIPTNAPPALASVVTAIEQYIGEQLRQPAFIPSYVKADLPSASKWLNCAIIVSDEIGGRTIATSDGTNWCRVKDGATVS